MHWSEASYKGMHFASSQCPAMTIYASSEFREKVDSDKNAPKITTEVSCTLHESVIDSENRLVVAQSILGGALGFRFVKFVMVRGRKGICV
jgi:Na+/H+-translocating membrane pyrophosphatase